ncbi:hypothetical protein CHLNCDRAFT_139528 [Chlorella variabilis]|uniref:Uncharacterized protein n=1 Tax=Chlorella variabilis TaxID=554065 RepID=E1ZQC2_CHLVA|nr:hypothetical protein CHLNCDRAFT_139528 [Chlorella variabilis]EFN51903.1 hypothetical protein CHLNCDRAFT_139528 [Chlorella variabilis]|eukprot:XP_005844005.1 hypothetical protein CHLNCDRAFT_139528 [Chlorella variabilis]
MQVEYLCWSLRPAIDAGFRGDVRAMRHIIAQQLAGSAPEPAKGRAQRGIVLAAGGQEYIANAFVNLYVLQRHLNCTLPVAIMYWGASKLDAISSSTQAFLQEHLRQVQLIDASKLPYPKHHRWLFPSGDEELFNGWKVKVFAAYAAPFDEILLLDGDSTPLQDPEPLFAHPSYIQQGSMFWPDAWCKRVELFARIGLADPWAAAEPRGGRRAPVWQAETGQFMLNRAQHRDVLEWLLFLNTRDEFSYWYGYGDKDTFLAAFMLAGKQEQYYQVPQPLSLPLSGRLKGWSKLRVQGLLQHHPDSSFMFLHRAGFHGRKYDPSQDQTRPVSHVVAQPTCEWNRLNKPFEEFVKLRQGRNTYTPQDCAYDLSSLQAVVAACGAERGRGQSRRAAKVPPEQPPIFEVGQNMSLALVQHKADAAFKLLRKAKQQDNTLF